MIGHAGMGVEAEGRSGQARETLSDGFLADLARLAALVSRAPAALVTVRTEDGRLIFIEHAWPSEEAARGESPGRWAFGFPQGLVIEDLHADRRFAGHTFTQRHPNYRFYAGVPIPGAVTAPSDQTVAARGTLSVIDQHPRRLGSDQLDSLRLLANLAAESLETARRPAAPANRDAGLQQALRLSRAYDHSLADALPQNVLRKDLSGRFTFVNRRFSETSGLQPADVIGKTDFDLYPAGMASKFQADDRKVVTTGEAHEYVETNQGAAGQISVHVIKSPIRDADGTVVGVQCIFWDVTDRRILEQELHSERQLLRAMLDVCPDLIYFKDRESRFLKVSRSLAERAGFSSPDEISGKTDADIFQSEHAEEALADERRVMEGGPPVVGKTEREVWSDGRVRYVTTSKIAWRDRDGAVVGLFGVSRDITELRKLELELHQAQKLESIGRLAAGVAHEINTPVQFVSDSVHFVRDAMGDLAGLIGKYQHVQQQVLAGQPAIEAVRAAGEAEETADLEYLLEQVPKALARSLDGLDRVATIVRSMKEFAHPDQKEMTLVDLNQAVRSTLTIARNEYKYVADVETELGALPLVRCHGGEVNQAILNVVVNAAHAIEDVVRGTAQKGRILARTWQDGATVVIAISDTGGGIPREVQERIFDPFFTTKDIGRGTGQGLAIARAVMVDKHGGDLTFDTQAGEGTTFFLRLPIEPEQREPQSF